MCAELDQKTAAFVNAVRSSQHFIVFTGAGISTAAGIGDYRGKVLFCCTRLPYVLTVWEMGGRGPGEGESGSARR
jgi:hypothetical protein